MLKVQNELSEIAAKFKRNTKEREDIEKVLAKTLQQIWESKEYYLTHKNFRDYVKEVFGISNTTAYRLLKHK